MKKVTDIGEFAQWLKANDPKLVIEISESTSFVCNKITEVFKESGSKEEFEHNLETILNTYTLQNLYHTFSRFVLKYGDADEQKG